MTERRGYLANHRNRREKGPQGPDSVRTYLEKAGRVALLSAEQEVELAKRIEVGVVADQLLEAAELANFSDEERRDPDIESEWAEMEWLARDGQMAKAHMAEANLRLVVSVAKRYARFETPAFQMLDMIQEGNNGLMHAIEKFDYEKGFKFSTYATWWIRQAITRAAADQARTIRLPVHIVEELNKVQRTKRELTAELVHDPTPEDIAERLDMPLEKVLELLDYAREAVSLNMEATEDGDELGTLLPDSAISVEAEVEENERAREVEALTAELDERTRDIILMRYGFKDDRVWTYQEIANKLKLSRERIRQIERKGLEALEKILDKNHKGLREYSDVA